MMKKISRNHMFILALSMAYSPTKTVDWERVGVGACVVGAVAALTGVIWAACAPESNEHMLERIQRDFDDASSVMPYVKACESSLHTSAYALHEHQLYTILHTSLKNTDIAALERTVDSILRDLDSGKRELEKRIRESFHSKPSAAIEAMKMLVGYISERQHRIQITLKTLLDCHGTYFKVVQYYHTLTARYTHELSVLNSYQYDKEHANFHIKAMVNNNRNGRQYPFIRYYDDIVRDQETLRRTITQLSHAYSDIMYKAQQLLREIEYIGSVIAMSSEYTRDTLQKEQDAIREAQRQLAAQQEKFAREQERARHEMRIAQIDLAMQQMAFKKEQEKELKKLKKERKKLEIALQLNRI